MSGSVAVPGGACGVLSGFESMYSMHCNTSRDQHVSLFPGDQDESHVMLLHWVHTCKKGMVTLRS